METNWELDDLVVSRFNDVHPRRQVCERNRSLELVLIESDGTEFGGEVHHIPPRCVGRRLLTRGLNHGSIHYCYFTLRG